MPRHHSHAWENDRCTKCWTRDEWPLGSMECPRGGRSPWQKATDEQVRRAWASVLDGRDTAERAAARIGIRYETLRSRARLLGLPLRSANGRPRKVAANG